MFRPVLRLVPTLAGRNQLNAAASMNMVSNMSTLTAAKGLQQKAMEQVRRLIASGVLMELRPPTPAEIPRAIRDLVRIVKGRNWKNVTMREACLNTLVTTEVICWFFVGEVIGKGTLIGYQV